jgi:aryl-alcohol dehydrogenase-like predicted oxidoreductase
MDWLVSEIGYGMWGMGGWTGSDDEESAGALDRAVARGCNFFDTARAYGNGHSEHLLGELCRRHPEQKLHIATKAPPKNRIWPGRATTSAADAFPYDYVVEMTRASRATMGVDAIDLQQLHVWDDAWTSDDGWKRAAERLKRDGVIRAFGISVNRWEPENVVAALETGLVDSVQVVYNIFDQDPEDVLFPICQRLDVAVIARVPFDEGSLTGTLTGDSRWPEGDFRNLYFSDGRLDEAVRRVVPLKAIASEQNATLPDLALRFILSHPAVTTTIPGMRKPAHVDANTGASDGRLLDADTLARLGAHRWNRHAGVRF